MHTLVASVALLAAAVSAHALTIERTRVDATLVDAGSTDPFRIRTQVGAMPAVDLTQVAVTIRFGDVAVDIPAGSFRRRKGGYAWKTRAPGVKRVTVKVGKSAVDVVGGGVELGDLPGPVPLTVAIGEEKACGDIAWAFERRSPRRRGTKKSADGTPPACQPQRRGPVQGIPPTLQITSPTVYDGISFAAASITLGGLAFDDDVVTGLTWTNDRGGGGSVLAAENWTITDIPLQPGDNRITVSALDPDGNLTNDVLVATYNLNGLAFDGVPVANPDALFVSEGAIVVVRQAIVANPDLDPASVHLVRVLDNGSENPVGAMADDGDLDGGDEIQADGVHTGKLTLGGIRTGLNHYRVSARTLSQPDLVALSPLLTMPIVEHVSQEQLDAAVALANDARALFETATAGGATAETALGDVVTLAQARGARLAGQSESGLGAWWVDANGLLGGVLGYDQTARRAGTVRPAPPASPAGPPRGTPPAARDGAGSTAVGSRRAAVLAPHFPDEEPADVAALLAASQCPPWSVDTWAGAEAGAERFQNLDRYGLVVIASHGDTFFHSIVDAYREEWRWSSIGAQAVLLTGTVLSAENLAQWEFDLRLGRLAIMPDGMAAILPSFITRHNVRFPSSVVYAGSCNSAFNTTLATAFFGRGAGTFYGYDGYVASSFARERGSALVTGLVAGQTTGAAFTPGLTDGNDPPATFMMLGRTDLALSTADVVNASFETESGLAGSVAGWTVTGDGRVIGALGATAPTDGSRMALISTGLGFTVDSGAITQPICLPALPVGATTMTLSWDWNFFSEEFLEYCDSPYQDSLSVELGAVVLETMRIDDLCNTVTSVEVDFDKGGVYATGWRTTTVDVTALAGSSGILRFAAHDVGDSIFDSAILIDRVTLTVE